MIHDIIDNRNKRLVDEINTILGSTEAGRFAVGYFFLSGFTAISEKLEHVKELRLLIGNTTNRETLEQIAEGYKRLELVKEAACNESRSSPAPFSRYFPPRFSHSYLPLRVILA
jgi:hypothetical protein